MAFELTQMSYTYLSLYTQCPWKFEQSYVLALPAPMPWALYFGRCWHEAIARGFTAMESRDVTDEIPRKVAAAAFEWWWEKGVTPDYFRGVVNFTDIIDWSENDPRELKRLGLAMIDSYLVKVAPTVKNVVSVEAVLSKDIEVTPGVTLPFVSHLDLITEDSIIDWKTSSRAWGKGQIAEDIQSSCYLLHMPDKKFYYHIGIKDYPIGWQVAEVVRTQEQLAKLEHETIPETFAGITAGRFPRRESWLCRYCGYQNLCN